MHLEFLKSIPCSSTAQPNPGTTGLSKCFLRTDYVEISWQGSGDLKEHRQEGVSSRSTERWKVEQYIHT